METNQGQSKRPSAIRKQINFDRKVKINNKQTGSPVETTFFSLSFGRRKMIVLCSLVMKSQLILRYGSKYEIGSQVDDI